MFDLLSERGLLVKGFPYLSLITDAYSRKIVGFYLSKDLSTLGSLKALKMALAIILIEGD